MKTYVGNAFSLTMLKNPNNVILSKRISKNVFDNHKKQAENYVGHENTAKLLNVEYNKQSIKLNDGDILYVASLNNTRLPENTNFCTDLLNPNDFKYHKVIINSIV